MKKKNEITGNQVVAFIVLLILFFVFANYALNRLDKVGAIDLQSIKNTIKGE